MAPTPLLFAATVRFVGLSARQRDHWVRQDVRFPAHCAFLKNSNNSLRCTILKFAMTTTMTAYRFGRVHLNQTKLNDGSGFAEGF